MSKENVIRSFVGNDAYYKGEDFPRFFVETNILPSFISSNYSDLIEEN